MKLAEMLAHYRAAAPPFMQEVAAEFGAMTPEAQRELLFWMVIDVTTNPTTIRSENVTAGNA